MRLATLFALASDKVTTDGVEVTSFPDLARRYEIASVPKTVVGDAVQFVGVSTEAMLLKHVQDAVGAAPAD